MKSSRSSSLFLSIGFLLALLSACQPQEQSGFDMDNLFAWCIVPFDSEERSPELRLEMLQELGFTKYAYDWREKHLPEMASEIKLAKEKGIEMFSVWMWIDANNDSIDHLSASNEKILKILVTSGLQTSIWLSFNHNYFADLPHQEALQKGVDMVDYIATRAISVNAKVGLYNHGDWFGDPSNQIEIIKALPGHELGLIYNFHHAHEQLDEFPEMAKEMAPYLWAVNLNGMKKEGPKILDIGKGEKEEEMIRLLMTEGYQGPWGILGHIETEDVKVVLERNLKGLRSLSVL